mmetsp:Transcript_146900/g.208244  ORF Transcript_146900/g.208244 Transcript_146900/m.208244 type:complete len:227 (-) Transcript_146900:43-723(-)
MGAQSPLAFGGHQVERLPAPGCVPVRVPGTRSARRRRQRGQVRAMIRQERDLATVFDQRESFPVPDALLLDHSPLSNMLTPCRTQVPVVAPQGDAKARHAELLPGANCVTIRLQATHADITARRAEGQVRPMVRAEGNFASLAEHQGQCLPITHSITVGLHCPLGASTFSRHTANEFAMVGADGNSAIVVTNQISLLPVSDLSGVRPHAASSIFCCTDILSMMASE